MTESSSMTNAESMPVHSPEPDPRITFRDIRRWMRDQHKFAMLTCYDATTARWLWHAGLKVMLVGDSAGEVILGQPSTIHAPLDFMIQLTAAVRRGAPQAFVMADMPFMTYHADEDDAVRNAGRFMTEGMADAVKLEVDSTYAQTVGKLARAAIPVVAHIGWRPQKTPQTGTAVVAGRNQAKIEELVDLAQIMEQRGASMLLIEASTTEAGQAVVDAVKIPVIGCGAGPACHGHVVILQDLLKLTPWQPSFVTQTHDLATPLKDAAAAWVDEVESGNYLVDGGPYHAKS